MTKSKQDPKDRLRSLRCQAAALERVSKAGYDGRRATEKAREGFWAQLETEVDPEGELEIEERRKRAQKLWQSRMAKGKANKLAGRGRKGRAA